MKYSGFVLKKADLNLLACTKFEVVYWKTEEHREQGISELAGTNMELDCAVFLCKQLMNKQGIAYAEVRVNDADHEEAVFYWL